MLDAFGVNKGYRPPGKILKPLGPITSVTESANPKIVGSNSPAAQRAKQLWQANQDKRTPQARNAWKTGRHVNA